MNILKNAFLIPALLFCNLFCYSQDKNRTTALDDKIMDKIAMLPEVIKADAYCKKKSKGKRHLFTYISSYPNKEQKYYMLNVAEDNGYAYHTWYMFIVYPITYKIEFFDPVSGRNIPLNVWRKHYKDY